MDEIRNDPLTINLRRQWDAIKPFLDEYIIPIPITPESIITRLSQLLFHRRYTILIASAFRPILIILSAKWLDQVGSNSEKLDAFASLLSVHEELYSYVYRQFFM